jgi:hypothetical protein
MLLILAFHGGKLLMLIQFLGDYTVWIWLMLLTFRSQLLPPTSEREGVKLASFCDSCFEQKKRGTRADMGLVPHLVQ